MVLTLFAIAAGGVGLLSAESVTAIATACGVDTALRRSIACIHSIRSSPHSSTRDGAWTSHQRGLLDCTPAQMRFVK